MAESDTTRVDKEQDDGDRQGRSRRVPHRSGIDSFANIKFKFLPYNGKYEPAAYLDWELEVEQQLSSRVILLVLKLKLLLVSLQILL
jgi:hypothetical protein